MVYHRSSQISLDVITDWIHFTNFIDGYLTLEIHFCLFGTKQYFYRLRLLRQQTDYKNISSHCFKIQGILRFIVKHFRLRNHRKWNIGGKWSWRFLKWSPYGKSFFKSCLHFCIHWCILLLHCIWCRQVNYLYLILITC